MPAMSSMDGIFPLLYTPIDKIPFPPAVMWPAYIVDSCSLETGRHFSGNMLGLLL
jgi:hypothetical protein